MWARDSRHGLYVREGVYPDWPVGTRWLAVTGVSVVNMAVSRSTVWVLSTSGDILKRKGVSSTNWVGDSWQTVPSPDGHVRPNYNFIKIPRPHKCNACVEFCKF